MVQLSLMAGVSPIRRQLMRCRAFFFSRSRSSAVTGQASSRGGGSLRGSPRRWGRRGNLRFRGLRVSPVEEHFTLGNGCPALPSATFSQWAFFGGIPGDEEHPRGSSQLDGPGALLFRAWRPRMEL